MSVNKVGIVIALATVAAIPTCSLYPFFHNRYVHPLGRLSGKVVVGMHCDQVRGHLEAYVASRATGPQFQLSEFDDDSEPFYLPALSDPIRSGFHAYDESPFDDVQLTVVCGPDGTVSHSVFVGD